MSKVEELSEKLCDWAKERQPHEPEFLFVDCLIDLIQAVRDEERGKHELKEDCRWNGGQGKTCNNCAWYQRCSEVIGLENSGSTKCDWHPSRFRELGSDP